jgi:hypothetical protein
LNPPPFSRARCGLSWVARRGASVPLAFCNVLLLSGTNKDKIMRAFHGKFGGVNDLAVAVTSWAHEQCGDPAAHGGNGGPCSAAVEARLSPMPPG